MTRRLDWRNEYGFTLVELMMTIIILIMLCTIAASTWFGAVESRRVDSATNQLAADLRLAHSKAMNRLAPQTATLTGDSSVYTVTGTPPRDLDDNGAENLVAVAASSRIVFGADGGAEFEIGANPIDVRSTNDTAKCQRIDVNTTTSRIKIVPCTP
jgi:prepilin-type N-terminal cleavage/methylation domain-containing protein